MLKDGMRNWAITRPDEFWKAMEVDKKHFEELKTTQPTAPVVKPEEKKDADTPRDSNSVK